MIDTSKEIVLKALGGHVPLTLEEVLNEAQDFEFKIFMYTGGGANPDQPTDPGKSVVVVNHQMLIVPGVEQISSIRVDPANISTQLRNRLRRQLKEAGTGEATLTMTITVSIDRSARITFDAKHERCWMGKGVLRIDATENA